MHIIPNRDWKIHKLLTHYLLKNLKDRKNKGRKHIPLGKDLHHRCPDTKIMCKSCPDSIHSLLNIVPLDHDFHINNKFFMSKTKEQLEREQAFLTSTGKNEFGRHWRDKYYITDKKKQIHKKMNDFVNGRTGHIW